MASGTLLDTRASLRNLGSDARTPKNSSQTQTDSLVFFRHLVKQLVRSNLHDRAERRKAVIDRLRTSRDPIRFIGELLDQCVVDHRPEGLDMAIDVLSGFGGHVIEYAYQFFRKDEQRWEMPENCPRHHIHDDVWYVLLRAIGASGLDVWQKISILNHCAADGTPSIREASIRALGDVGNPIALRLIRRLGATDASAMVRESAGEVLDDLEG